MSDRETVRAAYDNLPDAIRANLESIANGRPVPGHHGYRAGQWLKLVGVVLGLATITVPVAYLYLKRLSPPPIRQAELWPFAVVASLGFLMMLRNLRRLVIDPKLRLSRWVFVTPSLVIRVELGGASVVIHRLTNYDESKKGIVARQGEGTVSFFLGEQKIVLKGFESVPALLQFTEAVAEAVKHVRSRENDSEDAWLDRLDCSRAKPLARNLPVALGLTLVSFLLGPAAVAIVHLIG